MTKHIPEKGEHLVRYFGWYSHRQRGIRKKARQAGEAESDNLSIDRSVVDAQPSAVHGAGPGSMSTWAMLIKQVYEVDPLECPCCGGQMKFVCFIERCQAKVIEQILRHCGLWEGPLRTNAAPRAPPDRCHQGPTDSREFERIPNQEYLESEHRDTQAEARASCSWCWTPRSFERLDTFRFLAGLSFFALATGCETVV